MSTGVGIGTPGIILPIPSIMGLATLGVALPLIQYAIDRPQVNNISVAIIGCILNTATSVPLNAPKIIATTHAKRNAARTSPPEIPSVPALLLSAARGRYKCHAHCNDRQLTGIVNDAYEVSCQNIVSVIVLGKLYAEKAGIPYQIKYDQDKDGYDRDGKLSETVAEKKLYLNFHFKPRLPLLSSIHLP